MVISRGVFSFAGFQGQREGPEAVGVTAFTSVSAERTLPLAVGSFFDGSKVGANFGVARDFDGAVFEGHADGIG